MMPFNAVINRNKKPSIVFAAAEALPFAKTGGLADVVGALSAALVQKGASITVFLPLYSQIDQHRFLLKDTEKEISIPISDRKEQGRLYTSYHDGVHYVFIAHDRYFNRPGFYGTGEGDYFDNAERYLFFSRGVIEGANALGLQPDVFHCHDWHSALIPLYLKTVYADIFPHIPTVLTVHNLGYQGIFWHYDWHLLKLPWDYFNDQHLEFFGKINFLKGGLLYADLLTTVSTTYAREIQNPENGFGLDGVFRMRKEDLHGIINGIDTVEWDPSHDPHIAAHYTANIVSGKYNCKAALQKELGFPVKKNIPLLGMISRLADQKGIDLVAGVFNKIMKYPLQIVILGAGEKKHEIMLREISERYPDQAVVKIAYDPALAHRIEAGADIFLMPSRYEPCGLNQMMSLRYGTVPIVRATGGLHDTVSVYNWKTGKGNGFKFKSATDRAFMRQIKKALSLYKDKKHWLALMKNGMEGDYSWKASADTYFRLFETIIERQENR
ncbi:MAG: glycogen synthase GlgA [Nitrospiria bacterium]